jgi:EAL domain-containing protein (putative c-di-GMP-specific phosphodiesterase class I)
MVTAFVDFAGAADALVVAEGIEQLEDADVLRRLGVPLGQGYAFGRPALPAWSS